MKDRPVKCRHACYTSLARCSAPSQGKEKMGGHPPGPPSGGSDPRTPVPRGACQFALLLAACYWLLVVDVDQLAADRLVGAGLARRHVLRRPEDLGDLVRRPEQVLRRRQVDVLLAAGGELVGVPELRVQVGVLLQVLRPEVVVPEDIQLLLAELGVVLLRLYVAGERVDASPSLLPPP